MKDYKEVIIEYLNKMIEDNKRVLNNIEGDYGLEKRAAANLRIIIEDLESALKDVSQRTFITLEDYKTIYEPVMTRAIVSSANVIKEYNKAVTTRAFLVRQIETAVEEIANLGNYYVGSDDTNTNEKKDKLVGIINKLNGEVLDRFLKSDSIFPVMYKSYSAEIFKYYLEACDIIDKSENNHTELFLDDLNKAINDEEEVEAEKAM